MGFGDRARELVGQGSTAGGDSVWEEEPVDIQTFFKTFLKEPFFPKQLEFVEAMLGSNPKE